MTRTLTRRGLFGAAGALLAAPWLPREVWRSFPHGDAMPRVLTPAMLTAGHSFSSAPFDVRALLNIERASSGLGLWVHSCGAYTRREPDGTVRIFKTRAMGPTGLEVVMPEGFEP